MQRRIEIEGSFHQVAESPDGSVRIVGLPDVVVERLSNHCIEVFRDAESLGRFADENATWVPQPRRRPTDTVG